jgi:hypothetical protein
MVVTIDLDKELFVALPIFIIAVVMNLEILQPPNGLEILTQELYAFGSASFTVSRIAAIGALVFILVNRDVSLSETKGVDVWIVYATIGLIVTPPFVQAFQETLAEPGINILALIGQVMGFAIASALN